MKSINNLAKSYFVLALLVAVAAALYITAHMVTGGTAWAI